MLPRTDTKLCAEEESDSVFKLSLAPRCCFFLHELKIGVTSLGSLGTRHLEVAGEVNLGMENSMCQWRLETCTWLTSALLSIYAGCSRASASQLAGSKLRPLKMVFRKSLAILSSSSSVYSSCFSRKLSGSSGPIMPGSSSDGCGW